MAHQIDFSKGRAAMFTVKETAWHGLGEVLSSAPTLADALTLGGLDYEVALEPLVATYENNGIKMSVPVPGHSAVMRLDTNTSLGVVGSTYNALQNDDAFRPLEPLIESGVATIETGGALRGGRDVWMLVKFNIDDPKVRDVFRDEVEPYGLISNNHNGSRKVVLQETPIRVVCANTLGLALDAVRDTNGRLLSNKKLEKAITVRHTKNVKENVVQAAAELFGRITNRYSIIADQYAAMQQTILTEQQFARVVLDVLAPLPEKPKSERKDNIAVAAFERATDRAVVRRDRLATLWTDGDGHVGNHSAWEAYNAATQSLDHDANMWKVENRLEALFDGTLAKSKQEVVEAIVAECYATA